MHLRVKLRKFKTMKQKILTLKKKKIHLSTENVLEFVSHEWKILHIITDTGKEKKVTIGIEH